MPVITEVAPDLYRLSVYVPEFHLQFNSFLVKDEEPLLFHSGLKGMFPLYREAVGSLIEASQLRWIAFSHFESDECGALNEWLALAPNAQPVCSVIGAIVNVNDFAIRPARQMSDGEVLTTGKYRFRFCQTPHLPHGWDAGLLFEETQKTLLCSDLLHQEDDVAALTGSDVIERVRRALVNYQAGILANYLPYTPLTGRLMNGLADLNPKTLAAMHGSSFVGDGRRVLHDLHTLFREVFGGA
jgi:flavorubredoxin